MSVSLAEAPCDEFIINCEIMSSVLFQKGVAKIVDMGRKANSALGD